MSVPVTNATRRLDLRLPVVQGPFGGGLSSVQLTATVSNLGGLGSFGAHQLAPERIAAVADDLRKLTPNAFALNLWVSDHDTGGLDVSSEQFDQAWRAFEPWYPGTGRGQARAAAALPPGFRASKWRPCWRHVLRLSASFSEFPSAKVLAACRARGIASIGAATSIAEAQALDGAGVDLIVATGFEAGVDTVRLPRSRRKNR
jgi:nitronate monooxygenase